LGSKGAGPPQTFKYKRQLKEKTKNFGNPHERKVGKKELEQKRRTENAQNRNCNQRTVSNRKP